MLNDIVGSFDLVAVVDEKDSSSEDHSIVILDGTGIKSEVNRLIITHGRLNRDV